MKNVVSVDVVMIPLLVGLVGWRIALLLVQYQAGFVGGRHTHQCWRCGARIWGQGMAAPPRHDGVAPITDDEFLATCKQSSNKCIPQVATYKKFEAKSGLTYISLLDNLLPDISHSNLPMLASNLPILASNLPF